MTNGDLSKIKQKKPKIAVSLSLDKENVEFLKKHLEENYKYLTLSRVVDDDLQDLITKIKISQEKKKESEVKKESEE